jgi:predicted TIM-barrel fold metal-dependent hydrolase
MSPDEFFRLCVKHGTDRILFATDSPWTGQSSYVEAIRNLPFSGQEKDGIFGQNASKLLSL